MQRGPIASVAVGRIEFVGQTKGKALVAGPSRPLWLCKRSVEGYGRRQIGRQYLKIISVVTIEISPETRLHLAPAAMLQILRSSVPV